MRTPHDPEELTAHALAPASPDEENRQVLLWLGRTTKCVWSATSGLPSDRSNAVSGWNHGSVCSLQRAVRWPSQSMSMSARHQTAPLASHTGTVRPSSLSVLYLPLEICLQDWVFASSWLADGPAMGVTPALAVAVGTRVPVASRVAASRRSFRIGSPL